MELNQRLKQCRLDCGLTQQQVAEKIGVDTSTYAHYEGGRRMPDIKRLKMLCDLFDIAIQENFPLIRTLEYSPELLESLSNTKKKVENEFMLLKTERDKKLQAGCDKKKLQHELLWATHELIEQLQAAIDPVKKIWEDTTKVPEIDQAIIRVNYRPEDWQLLSESIQLQSELIHFMF